MRSRTSRGVPEWSGGKDLYMGSPVFVTGKVSGFIGNVPGPPGGSRGSTKWGPPALEGFMGQVWEGTSPWWAGAPPPTKAHAPKGKRGQTLRADGP